LTQRRGRSSRDQLVGLARVRLRYLPA